VSVPRAVGARRGVPRMGSVCGYCPFGLRELWSRGAVRGVRGDGGGEAAVAGLYSGGLHIILRAAVRRRCLAMQAMGGRQASL
jgi:hypothetical protein